MNMTSVITVKSSELKICPLFSIFSAISALKDPQAIPALKCCTKECALFCETHKRCVLTCIAENAVE